MSDAVEPCLLCAGTGERVRPDPAPQPDEIKARVLACRKALQRENAEHASRVQVIREELERARDACPHDGPTHYNGDPTGGSDSWLECLVCGADVRRKGRRKK